MKTEQQHRAEMAARAERCRVAARRAGLRHTLALIDKLAELTPLTDDWAYPSVEYLRHELGVCERTVRHWTAALERAGIIAVHRSDPRKGEGGAYTRRTNRYRLTDRRAAQRWGYPDTRPSAPLPYRLHRSRRYRYTDPDHMSQLVDEHPTWTHAELAAAARCDVDHVPRLLARAARRHLEAVSASQSPATATPAPVATTGRPAIPEGYKALRESLSRGTGNRLPVSHSGKRAGGGRLRPAPTTAGRLQERKTSAPPARFEPPAPLPENAGGAPRTTRALPADYLRVRAQLDALNARKPRRRP